MSEDIHPDDPGFMLKPCPFCGSTSIVKGRRIGWPVATQCGDCGAEGPVKLTGREADAAWNKRQAKP